MESDEDEELGNANDTDWSNAGAKKAKKPEPKTPHKTPKTPKKAKTPQKTMPTKTPQKAMPTKTPSKNNAQPVKPATKTMGKTTFI